MLQKTMDELVTKVGGSIVYIYSQENQDNMENENEMVGYCDEQLLRDKLSKAGNDTLNLYCGPPPMNKVVNAALMQIGHEERMIIKF